MVSGAAWDFHRSVLSALVNRRRRLTPRGSGRNSRDAFSGAGCWWQQVSASARLGAWHTTRGRTATPPVLSLPGPFVTGHYCPALAARTFPCGKFEQGFLDEHGPAQVRLGLLSSRKWPHCLRLSRQHLRFTLAATRSRRSGAREENLNHRDTETQRREEKRRTDEQKKRRQKKKRSS